MNPNQQPNSAPQPQPPVPQQPAYSPVESQPAPQPQQPVFPPQTTQTPQTFSPQPTTPNPTVQPAQPAYDLATPSTNYDPNYLDAIAPAPPRPTFFSGGFGKIFFGLLGVFVLAVSLIIAFSGKDKTADLQQTTVRVTNFVTLTKTEQTYLKSNKLSAANTSFGLLLTNAKADGEKLLGQAGVKKTQYNKTMTASEKKLSANLTQKFEDARLNAQLDSTYARTMAGETAKLIALFNTMSKKSGAKAIRAYAKNLATNLTPLQKQFNDYVDDGN